MEIPKRAPVPADPNKAMEKLNISPAQLKQLQKEVEKSIEGQDPQDVFIEFEEKLKYPAGTPVERWIQNGDGNWESLSAEEYRALPLERRREALYFRADDKDVKDIYLHDYADVMMLQAILTSYEDIDPGPLDGKWGPKTQAALLAWQKKYNAELKESSDKKIGEDGQFGAETFGAMQKVFGSSTDGTAREFQGESEARPPAKPRVEPPAPPAEPKPRPKPEPKPRPEPEPQPEEEREEVDPKAETEALLKKHELFKKGTIIKTDDGYKYLLRHAGETYKFPVPLFREGKIIVGVTNGSTVACRFNLKTDSAEKINAKVAETFKSLLEPSAKRRADRADIDMDEMEAEAESGPIGGKRKIEGKRLDDDPKFKEAVKKLKSIAEGSHKEVFLKVGDRYQFRLPSAKAFEIQLVPNNDKIFNVIFFEKIAGKLKRDKVELNFDDTAEWMKKKVGHAYAGFVLKSAQ